MTKSIKIVSFRATSYDLELINKAKEILGEGIRNVSDSDVIRKGIELIGQKKNIKNFSTAVIQDTQSNSVKDVEVAERGKEELVEMVKKIPTTPEIHPDRDSRLTEEEWRLGYQYLKGDLCDKDGYPIEYSAGDVVVAGGNTYVTDPGRTALKEQAKENMQEIIVESPSGKVNEALATFLEETPISKHQVEGMLTSQHDGVDEDNFLD